VGRGLPSFGVGRGVGGAHPHPRMPRRAGRPRQATCPPASSVKSEEWWRKAAQAKICPDCSLLFYNTYKCQQQRAPTTPPAFNQSPQSPPFPPLYPTRHITARSLPGGNFQQKLKKRGWANDVAHGATHDAETCVCLVSALPLPAGRCEACRRGGRRAEAGVAGRARVHTCATPAAARARRPSSPSWRAASPPSASSTLSSSEAPSSTLRSFSLSASPPLVANHPGQLVAGSRGFLALAGD
jgi:hypothetical protein